MALGRVLFDRSSSPQKQDLNHDQRQPNMNLMQQTLRRYLCITLMLCAIPAVLPLRAQKPAATPGPAATPAPAATSAPATTPARAGASSSADPGWPREATQNGAKLIYYQ